ncbi:MAG: class I SAM-dependent methyltransferase [Propionicimonas sp.]|nr:class I SAM-dependent methyltransferase [Propionicimonas sp.]
MNSSMWDARYAASQVWDLEPSPTVVEALEGMPRGRALDVGAGEGRHSLWLASRGWQVTAVDQSTVAVGRIQARAAMLGLDIEAEVADVTHFAPRRRGFDLVLFSYLQLPMVSLKLALRTGAAALAEAGELFLVAHDLSNVANGYGGPSDPDLMTSADAVAAVLTAAGLEVTRAQVVTRQVTTDTGLRFALDHVVQAVQHEAA